MKLIIGYLMCFFFMTSCKKSFLDVENTSVLNRQTYVKDLATMEQFMNGIYVLLNYDYEKGIGSAYPDLVADNLMPLPPPSTQSLLAHYNWSQKATDMQEEAASESSMSMNGTWKTGYQIIRACNFVVENISKYRSENATKADDINGQALAIRAMIHFKLVNIFAQCYKYSSNASHLGIPYITTSNIGKPYSRQNVAEVYELVIDDFKRAIQLLPVVINDTRFMNIAAAKGLLSRVYLFKEDFESAKKLATEIALQFPLLKIENGYPEELFKDKLPSKSEVLYRLTPVTQPGITSVFLGARLRNPLLRYVATDDVARILTENENDIRKKWVVNISGNWNVNKFPEDVTPELNLSIPIPSIAYYHPVIRSSEMFLTVAESAAKIGDENTARNYLDAIRKRADTSIASILASGSALLDSIYKERRKELSFEQMRMFDLQRWKLGVHRLHVLADTPKDLPFPSDKAISPIHQLDVSMVGLQQNSGY